MFHGVRWQACILLFPTRVRSVVCWCVAGFAPRSYDEAQSDPHKQVSKDKGVTVMAQFPPVIIDLESRPDRWGKSIYIGKVESPCMLSFKRGVMFLLFNADPGVEELRIGTPSPGSACGPIKKSFKHDGTLDRYHVPLEADTDRDGKTYYRALVQDDNLILDFAEGFLFFAFVSKSGSEEIQIVMKDPVILASNRERRVSGVIEVIQHHRTIGDNDFMPIQKVKTNY